MKTFLLLLILAGGGYFAYEHLIKEKTVLEITADKSITTENSTDINAPALTSAKFGSVRGTATNVSDKTVTNIVLKYKLNTELLEARINQLEPGESKDFSTQSVRLRHVEVTFYLEEMSYE